MQSIVVRLVYLSLDKIRKILNGPLPALVGNYKNKRPPPAARQFFYAAVTIWTSQFNHLIIMILLGR